VIVSVATAFPVASLEYLIFGDTSGC
jgi:hypothetical protein